jgi:hypothetical protein
MRNREYYVAQMEQVKELKLQPIDSITMVSLAALLADYYEHRETVKDCTLDEFYDYKRLKLLGQKADTDEWKSLIEKDPNYQALMSSQTEQT